MCILSFSAIDEEQETFTTKDIKEKIGGSWKPFFKEGVEKIKVEQVETCLTPCAAEDDIRYDFAFFTPSIRDVRVKVSLYVGKNDNIILQFIFMVQGITKTRLVW